MEKIRSTFERKGYPSESYIDRKEFIRVLNSLMPSGGEFYEEVADELWMEAAGERPPKEIRVQEICNTIYNAQSILSTRIAEAKDKIFRLEEQKRKLQLNASKESSRRIQELTLQINELYEEKESFEDDYVLVTEPFGIQPNTSPNRFTDSAAAGLPKNQTYPTADSRYEQHHDHQGDEDSAQSEELKVMFYLAMALGFVEVIMIYGKPDFLNLIVLACIFSIYLLNFLDKPYVRLTLALILVSIVLDVLWLIMYAGIKWSPSEVSNTTIYELGYMRFIVFFTVLVIPLKLAIFFFLFKFRNTQAQDKYDLSLGIVRLTLTGNKFNPISSVLPPTPLLKQ